MNVDNYDLVFIIELPGSDKTHLANTLLNCRLAQCTPLTTCPH